MSTVLAELSYWHWFMLSVGLMIAETLVPGAFLLWFGVGAAAAGFAVLAIPSLGWQTQAVIFALVSLASLVAWRRYRAQHPETSSHPTLNQRGTQYVGRRFTLTEPIVDGYGRLHADDTHWRIAGPDLPAGTHVTVTGVDGIVLEVERSP